MANALFGKSRQLFLEGGIAILTDNIKLCFVDAAVYTPSIDVHDFLDDIASVIATSGNFANKTSTLGVFDADDVVVSSVSGATFEYIVGYKDSGSAATSPLIMLIDTATGLPFTPTGNNVTVAWSNSAERIFKL